MSLLDLLVIAVGLSMDAFAVSVCKGLSLQEAKPGHMALAGAWFGGFQALMPTIGFLFGSLFAERIAKYDHWAAFLLLALIGGNMIRESFSPEEEEHTADLRPLPMFLLAVATSIDALAVGVSFAFLRVRIVPAALLIGSVTFVLSALGVKAGSLFGNRFEEKAERAGGVMLILIGLRILLEGLGILA